MGDDVGSEDPRPNGHYHVDRNAEWYYVNDDLAGTIALGPATDGGPGDDWVLTLSAATPDGDPDAAERVAVRLTPWALHELYIDARNLSPDARQAGHSAKCGLCIDRNRDRTYHLLRISTEPVQSIFLISRDLLDQKLIRPASQHGTRTHG